MAAIVITSSVASAHHSPSEVIADLTRQIENLGPTASRHIRRGDEYRAMGSPQEAIADYEAALKLEPDSATALYGMTHALLSLDDIQEALSASQRAIDMASGPDQAAPFYALKARAYERSEEWLKSVAAWRHALESSRPEIDWFLGEAYALSKAGRPEEARRALESAMKRNPSVVLRRAWIQALIAADDLTAAEQEIESSLAKARMKSYWLVLRSELRMKQNRGREAKHDANLAIEEIDERARVNPNAANPLMSGLRRRALTVLGDSDYAWPDYLPSACQND